MIINNFVSDKIFNDICKFRINMLYDVQILKYPSSLSAIADCIRKDLIQGDLFKEYRLTDVRITCSIKDDKYIEVRAEIIDLPWMQPRVEIHLSKMKIYHNEEIINSFAYNIIYAVLI